MNSGYQVRVNYGAAAPAPRPEPPKQTPQELQARALAVARCFEPKRAVGVRKVRVGSNFDGGYVHLDDFAGVGAALSLGISSNVAWDLEIAQRNIKVYQFDDSIERSPLDHPLFEFHKIRIAGADGPGAQSLDTLVERYLGGCERAILKIDIEGHEWEALGTISSASLARFSQIVCEFHGLERCADPAWAARFMAVLGKLREQFEVVHVHGNNAMPFANIANVVLPILLEVALANRKYYEFAETNEIFPTELDQPNLRAGPDMRLGCFKF